MHLGESNSASWNDPSQDPDGEEIRVCTHPFADVSFAVNLGERNSSKIEEMTYNLRSKSAKDMMKGLTTDSDSEDDGKFS